MKGAGMIRNFLLIITAVVFLALSVLPAYSSDSPDPREAKLQQRVNDYWETRKSGKTEMSYTYYDPFFKARVTRKHYESNLIDIKFHNVKMGNAEIVENIAKVKIEVEYEIPESVIMGKKIFLPKRGDSWVEDWIWIDGDWFKVFKVNINNTYIPFFPSFPP